MAGKVFFSVSMSLDGFIAPGSIGELMGQQWMELQQWIFPQRFFRESLKLGEGGEEGRDNDIVRETYERTGASVTGKRMFDAGEQMWPEEAPFHSPVFVVTHEKRDPWERPGGTTFHFVNDGIEPAGAAGDPPNLRNPGAVIVSRPVLRGKPTEQMTPVVILAPRQ
jgi:dihydrofolate reductase